MAFANPMKDHRKLDCTNLMKLTYIPPKQTERPRQPEYPRPPDTSYKFERINIRKNEPEPEYPGMNFSEIPWEPVFMSVNEKHWLKKEPDCMKNNFFKRLTKGGEEELKMFLLPKPQKKAMRFCGSCYSSFQDDYVQHVKSKGHNINFQKNDVIDLLQKESDEIHKEFERNIIDIIQSAPAPFEFEEEGRKTLSVHSSKKKVINGHSIENKENIKDSVRNKQAPFHTQSTSYASPDNLSFRQQTSTSQIKKKGLPNPNPNPINPFPQERNQSLNKIQLNRNPTSNNDWRASLITPEARFAFLSQQSKNFEFQRPREEERIISEEENKTPRRYYAFEKVNNQVFYRQLDSIMDRDQNCWNRSNRDPVDSKPQFQKQSPSYQTQAQKNIDLNEIIAKQKQSKKRSYSNTDLDQDQELLMKFKKVKITEGFSQSQSQSGKDDQELITIDLKNSKWENLKKSFNDFVTGVSNRVARYYDFLKGY